jgi:hypothetical protein
MAVVEDNSFREANDQIRDLAVHKLEVSSNEHTRYLCECADPACVETIELTVDEYDEVSDLPGVKVVAPGHGSGADVRQRNGRFWIVRLVQSDLADAPSAENLDAVLDDLRDKAADIRRALQADARVIREAPSESG